MGATGSEVSWVQVEDGLWARPQAEHGLDGGRSWVRTNGFLVGAVGSRAVSLGVGAAGVPPLSLKSGIILRASLFAHSQIPSSP